MNVDKVNTACREIERCNFTHVNNKDLNHTYELLEPILEYVKYAEDSMEKLERELKKKNDLLIAIKRILFSNKDEI